VEVEGGGVCVCGGGGVGSCPVGSSLPHPLANPEPELRTWPLSPGPALAPQGERTHGKGGPVVGSVQLSVLVGEPWRAGVGALPLCVLMGLGARHSCPSLWVSPGVRVMGGVSRGGQAWESSLSAADRSW
jgi:hypothetical protein